MREAKSRRGFSIIELEVAFIVFVIAISGLCPLVVMQSKQLKKMEERLNHQTVYYIVPSSHEWARKLGVAAHVTTVDTGPLSTLPVMIIDDGEPGFSVHGDEWEETENEDAYASDVHIGEPGDGTGIARWQFSGLEPGTYEVQITWTADEEFAPDAPFKIWTGSHELGAVSVNQQVMPDGEVFHDRSWLALGMYQITNGELSVELDNSSPDKVMADGVRLKHIENAVLVDSVQKQLNSEDVTAHVSVTRNLP